MNSIWFIVKGKGDYIMKPKAHLLMEETGEGRTRRSECGQFLIPIQPFTSKSHSEVQCKKCILAVRV